MIELNKIYNEDCLEGMKRIPDGSVDMILCDLPYGTTACKWDSVIPLDEMWAEYKRVIKKNGAIVLTATNPFSSILIASNLKGFKHEWIWRKERGVGFQVAKYRPMQEHEHVVVFSSMGERVNYSPIMVKRDKPLTTSLAGSRSDSSPVKKLRKGKVTYTHKHPLSILEFPRDNKLKLHPTQKPVGLFEYLIRTYTNEGDTVLDNCMGSGTTAIACMNTGRNFIGFELEGEYFHKANERIKQHQPTLQPV